MHPLKNPLTYDVLGTIFGMNTPNAHRNISIYLPLVRLVLDKLSLLPVRDFEFSDWTNSIGQDKEILIDATEIPIQRPKDQLVQKSMFGEKKEAHDKMHNRIA